MPLRQNYVSIQKRETLSPSQQCLSILIKQAAPYVIHGSPLPREFQRRNNGLTSERPEDYSLESEL